MTALGEAESATEAATTHGAVRLEGDCGELAGAVLFSHPADLTLVCTTEFTGLAEIRP
jgi:alkyl hydroperoxide reductase subunit AhpC